MATAGISLALCAMYKGMTVLGFLPVLAFLQLSALFRAPKAGRPRLAGLGIVAVLCFLVPLAASFVAVRRSRCSGVFPGLLVVPASPTVLALAGVFPGSFAKDYWQNLLKYSYYLTPLALLPLGRITSGSRIQLPAILLATFIVMFAGARLNGGQYLLMVLPWLAWLISEGIAD